MPMLFPSPSSAPERSPSSRDPSRQRPPAAPRVSLQRTNGEQEAGAQEATSDTSRIGARCARIAHALDAPAADEITLLRSARALKGVHSDLRQAIWSHARGQGRTPAIASAVTALDAMEQHLRSVLLEYPALPGNQLRDHVVDALDRSIELLDLLDA